MAFRRKFLRHARLTKFVTDKLVEALRKTDTTADELRKAFYAADVDRTGTLEMEELKTILVMKGFDAPTDVFEEVMKRFDVDGTHCNSP